MKETSSTVSRLGAESVRLVRGHRLRRTNTLWSSGLKKE